MNEMPINVDWYFDTSALLPYYRDEPLSEVVESQLQTTSAHILVSVLTEVELFSAIARWRRLGEINETEALSIQQAFTHHLEQKLYKSVLLGEVVFYQAKKWLSVRKTTLRTLDALHLASAHSGNAQLITADIKLAQAAEILQVNYQLLTV